MSSATRPLALAFLSIAAATMIAAFLQAETDLDALQPHGLHTVSGEAKIKLTRPVRKRQSEMLAAFSIAQQDVADIVEAG